MATKAELWSKTQLLVCPAAPRIACMFRASLSCFFVPRLAELLVCSAPRWIACLSLAPDVMTSKLVFCCFSHFYIKIFWGFSWHGLLQVPYIKFLVSVTSMSLRAALHTTLKHPVYSTASLRRHWCQISPLRQNSTLSNTQRVEIKLMINASLLNCSPREQCKILQYLIKKKTIKWKGMFKKLIKWKNTFQKTINYNIQELE